MTDPFVAELQEQGRGFTGAFLVAGVTLLYTMETWQLGTTLPMSHLIVYAVVGLSAIIALTQASGFRQEDHLASPASDPVFALVVESAEILFQSALAAYVGLLLLGVLTLSDPVALFVRLGLIEIVPLGFGAAVANRLVGEDINPEAEGRFPRNFGVFALGAVFIAIPIAPTAEVTVIAVQIGWAREIGIVVLSIILTYLILYELEFKGQDGRLQTTRWLQFGTTLLAYAVAIVVSFVLLLAYGQFIDIPFPVIVQKTIVLSLPASLGAAGGEVVL